METTIFCETMAACREIDNGRTLSSVLISLVSEVGELAEEVNIVEGFSYKTHGADGVLGEAADVIAAVVDLIYVMKPDITEAEMMEILRPKLEKWKNKTKEHGHFRK